MRRTYTPRRASKKRWLENAPEWVLDVFDDKNYPDRYTILLTGSMLIRNEDGTYVQYIGSTEHGGTYWGELTAHEARRFRYASGHQRIAWMALPESVRKTVIARVTEPC